MTTIVNKLFNIVQPDVACFGEKDFQQLAVIRKMVDDLAMDIEIIGVPTVREMDGLAMSSRNGLLTLDERQRAPVLARTMRWISSAIRGGRDDYASIIEDANDQLRAAGLHPDEIFIRDARTLQVITPETTQAVILMSAFLGQTRLIDNQTVDMVVESKDETESNDAQQQTLNKPNAQKKKGRPCVDLFYVLRIDAIKSFRTCFKPFVQPHPRRNIASYHFFRVLGSRYLPLSSHYAFQNTH